MKCVRIEFKVPHIRRAVMREEGDEDGEEEEKWSQNVHDNGHPISQVWPPAVNTH
jgi:hypothetical protein